jgi:hypothetical protein
MPDPPVAEAADVAAAIASPTMYGTQVCDHAIPAERDSCRCGARRAYLAGEYQPVLA